MAEGYNGRILRVDLSSGAVSVEEPDPEFYRTYLGGWGFIAYYLLRELEPGVDPLGPDNKLIFAGGVYTDPSDDFKTVFALGIDTRR